MALQLEVGKYYRTRDGRKVQVIGDDRSATYPMDCDDMNWRTRSGFDWGEYQEREDDLIAEWHDTPDLTAITTPFGLLDEATQEALRAHGGPYEWWCHDEWIEDPHEDFATGSFVVRVKPAPKMEMVAQDWFLDIDGCLYTHAEIGTPVRVTFTRTKGVIDLDSYKVEAR